MTQNQWGEVNLGGTPSRGILYSRILERLRELQEDCIMMGHLHQTEGTPQDRLLATGWLGIGELLQRLTTQVTKLAMKKIN